MCDLGDHRAGARLGGSSRRPAAVTTKVAAMETRTTSKLVTFSKSFLLLFVAVLLLANCASRDNSGRSYAGSPGSTYDTALNPPKADGVVIYDPSIPIAAHDYGNSGGGYRAAAPGP